MSCGCNTAKVTMFGVVLRWTLAVEARCFRRVTCRTLRNGHRAFWTLHGGRSYSESLRCKRVMLGDLPNITVASVQAVATISPDRSPQKCNPILDSVQKNVTETCTACSVRPQHIRRMHAPSFACHYCRVERVAQRQAGVFGDETTSKHVCSTANLHFWRHCSS